MQLSEYVIKKLITEIGFAPQDGESGIFCKSYPLHNGYSIFVNFNKETILYDSGENSDGNVIKVWEKTTSNFSQTENFVVLECVDRLLEKGYAPACIELERTYPSGHGRSGRLDIFVKSIDGIPFLMIECKTWGAEFEKERDKMLKNGGQLFTYYTNDRDVKFLCLYASHIDDARACKCAIIDVDLAWASLSGVKEIYGHWNKNFKDDGIFDSFATPYDVKHKALTYGKLNTLKEEHSGKIYNQIMEILRHNAISDKPNAFNKLLNLFVCKIIDESDKNPGDELEFQWLENDTDETLQLRLNDLYKKGMWRFLEIKVIDYEQREVAEKLESIEDALTQQWIMKMYTDTRLKKSPNFAFTEVHDDRTFALNARVVREIVKLIQEYKFRYEQKHEFLGNFFELLLNTSMKQESGQYFTPVPITRFIISSLPLDNLIQERIDNRAEELLPTVIDYACGSGHFLTEYMSQVQKIIDCQIDLAHTSPRIKNLFQSWQGYTKFLWAKESVYGIDLDNRLVKTTKISAFFNGDGEANIVWANGLDHFTKSEAYRGKLKYANGQDNGQFDILISNPPYSVDAFKSTIASGKESFSLYENLTDNSSEIECLFAERMKQLLRIGGLAAVILPSSILSNGGIHARAREILLKYFRFKAVVELGSGTFMKTGTNTVILFLERRSDNDHKVVSREIDRFFSIKKDVAVDKIENAFSVYVNSVYDALSLNDYISIFSAAPSEIAKNHELYLDYQKTYGEDYIDKAIDIEKEKMLYFLLTYHQKVVLVNTGNGKEEKKILGYEFSERRGHEGLHPLPGGTKLYDEADPLNPCKVSSYIYRAFLGETADVDLSLAENVRYGRLCQFIEYGTSKFNQFINLGKTPCPITKWNAVKLENLISPIKGVQAKILQKDILQQGGSVPVVSQDSDSLIIGYSNHSQPITDLPLILMGDHTCVFKYIDFPFVCGSDNTPLIKFDDNRIIPKFGYYVLSNAEIQNAGKYERHFKYVKNLKIPLPPLEMQREIVDEMEALERDEENLKERLFDIHSEIKNIIEETYHAEFDFVKLRTVATYSEDKVNAQELSEDTYVGVDNLLPDVGGKRASAFVPTSGMITAYHPGNILISNIRPYLKKAWLADNHGGASGDVLVLAVNEEVALSEYIFCLISADRFFDYEMQNIGSNVKMPRANKEKVLDFRLPLPSIQKQQSIIDDVSRRKIEISQMNAQLDILKAKKKFILEKYL